MGIPNITFQISKIKNCPIYRDGDSFTLSGVTVFMDNGMTSTFVTNSVIQANQSRENCKILNADFIKIIIEHGRADQIPECTMTCSGCEDATIELEYSHHHSSNKGAVEKNSSDTEKIAVAAAIEQLRDTPFFSKITAGNLKEIIECSDLETFSKDEIILHKGEPGSNFYIIVSGKVDVVNETGITITTLGRGEVFGEMSLLCDKEIGATIQASETTEVLNIDHRHFKKILYKFPSLQLFFTQLLAQRLNTSNRKRSEDYASSIIGKLEEIPPDALFQTLNSNAKTGVLTITELPEGTARFSIRQGELIRASYGSQEGEEAFYAILREKNGRFKFKPELPPEDQDSPEIGYFMKLLMEGLQRIDEEQASEND